MNPIPLTKELTIPVPPRIAALPKASNGYHVPWFVKWMDGKPEFRLMDNDKWIMAVKHNICWVCGRKMGSHKAFVIGPMCGINRTSSEPPSHLDCATYSAQVCPFLANPNFERRETGIDYEKGMPAGVMIQDNPGVVLVWVTKKYTMFMVKNGPLLEIGEPDELLFYTEGRMATKEEVKACLLKRIPILSDAAWAEGKEAVTELKRLEARFQTVMDMKGKFA